MMNKLFLVVLVWGVAAGAEAAMRRRRDVNWNDLADSLLSYGRDEIISQGKQRVQLPDVHENFKKKLGFIRLKGEFRATEGWLENFASMYRVGDTTVTHSGTSSVMTVVLSLNDLRLGYGKYEAEVWGGGPDGTLEGKIGKNAVKFVIVFDLVEGECVTSLRELKVVEFDDFSVTMSGLGSFDWLAEKAVEWVINSRRDRIKESIEKQLIAELQKALKNFQCDEFAVLMIPI